MRTLEGRLAKLEATIIAPAVNKAVHVVPVLPSQNQASEIAALIEGSKAMADDFFIVLCSPEGFERREA